MWVIPKAAGSHPWPLWSTQRESTWFLLTRNNVGLMVDKPYRIIFKTGKNEGYLVAVGKEDEIMKAWKFIEDNIAVYLNGTLSRNDSIEYALGKFRSLALDEELRTLPPEAQARPDSPYKLVDINMDEDEYDGQFYFESGDITVVERDLGDLAREDPFFATNQLANLNLLKPTSNIPSQLGIPDTEQLLAIFGCSMWTTGALPRLGELLLTPNYIGFHANAVLMFSAQFITIRMTDVVHIQFFTQSGFECIQLTVKQRVFIADQKSASSNNSGNTGTIAGGGMNNNNSNDRSGGQASLSGFHTLAFAALYGGLQIFEEVSKIWKLSMKKFQASESDKKRVREGEIKDEYLVTYEEAIKMKSDPKPESSDALNLPSDSSRTGAIGSAIHISTTQSLKKKKRTDSANMAKKGLERLRKKVIQQFRLPESEYLLTQARATLTIYAKRGNSFVKSSTETANVEGMVYLTTHFLCFLDNYLFTASSLGQESELSAKSGLSAAIQKSMRQDDLGEQLNDDAQNTAVLLAEWDVAAAEDESVGSASDLEAQRLRHQQLRQQVKKKVPASSLATADDAPSRLWLVVPLREIAKLKVGKPSASVSTAYADFGVAPHVVNVHLPYNMYSLTFINRPYIFDCIAKAHSRTLRQETRRVPLPSYSLADLAASQANASVPNSPQGRGTDVPSANNSALSPTQSRKPQQIPSPGTSPTQTLMLQSPISSQIENSIAEPPPRSVFFKHVTQHPLSSGEAKFPESILSDTRQFASTYRARERLQEEKFLNYFHKYGQSNGFARKGPDLPLLVRNGIPHSLRGHLWFTLSGACHRMAVAPANYYQSLLETHGGKASTAVEQIERDLHRSMPNHPFYSILKPNASSQTEAKDKNSTANNDGKPTGSAPSSNPVSSATDQSLPAPSSAQQEYQPCHGNTFHHPLHPPSNEPMGISRLRRVLVAYSWHNPVIAYCQSMNIVTAALLLYMSEEEAFYTLITLVEYLEEYWTREMLGAIVDMLVLQDILRQRKPTLVAHLEELELDYSIVALPWFMCLFIGYVPLQLALRLMDCFFYNAGMGKATATLFQAAITMFSIAESELMESYDPVTVSTVLRRVPYEYDCDKLISMICSGTAYGLRSNAIEELRNFHRYNAVQNIEVQNMEEEFAILVYGKQAPIVKKLPILSDPSNANSERENDSATQQTPKKPEPPPTTPVHFPLGDLKRLYLDFKDTVLSHPDAASENEFENRTKIINTKSVLSSLNKKAFHSLFKQHFAWWPSIADPLLSGLFEWMDVTHTGRLSFVEYIQGLEVIVYGNPETIVSLYYDLMKDPNTPGITETQFKLIMKAIYYTELYSKANTKPDPENAKQPPAKRTARPRVDVQSVAVSDNLDDWFLLDADEKLDSMVTPEMLVAIFQSYADHGVLTRDKFLICALNQLKLVPPSTVHDF